MCKIKVGSKIIFAVPSSFSIPALWQEKNCDSTNGCPFPQTGNSNPHFFRKDHLLPSQYNSFLWPQNLRVAEDEMVGWHYWLKGCEFGQTPGGNEGQGSLVCSSPCGRGVRNYLAIEQQQNLFLSQYNSFLWPQNLVPVCVYDRGGTVEQISGIVWETEERHYFSVIARSNESLEWPGACPKPAPFPGAFSFLRQ